MPCWTVAYYFRRFGQRKRLRGQICGCVEANSRQEAIDIIRNEGDWKWDCDLRIEILQYVAVRRPADHTCSLKDAAERKD